MGKGGKGAHHHHRSGGSRSSYSRGRNRGGFFFHHRGPSHSHVTYRGHRSYHRFQVRAAVTMAAGGTLTVGLMGRRSHRHRTHVGYVPQRPLMAGPMAYAALFRGLVDFVDHTEVDEVSEQRRWAIDCSGDDQNGTALQFHLWRRAHRYVAPDFYDAPAATTEPADDDAWRAELPPDGPNFAVVDIALIAKEPEAAADTLNDCGLGQKLGPPARQLIRDVAAACRGFYGRKTTKMVCCCFEVDDAAAVEDRNDDIEDAAVAALGRGAAGQLPRDATVSFVRLGALLAVVFEIVPPAPAGVASFPPTGAAAAPRTFEVKPLVVGPVDMDGVVEENASSSSSDDDDDDVTRTNSGLAALRQKYSGRASYVEGESADYVATAPAYPTVTVEAAPVVCRPVSSWTGPPPPLVEAELRAAHAIASAARGEFVPQFSQALWQATAHVNATTQNPSGAAVLRALEDFTFTAPQGALPGTSFVVRAPTGALIAATFPPGIGPGYNIYVHAPGAWGAIATSAEAPSPRPGAYPPPPHYQAPVALVTAAGVGEPAPVPGAPVQGWGA
ncbi:unnamed protein product [Pelagomonas calceolata]|uniref:Uncharacterized protein n=2 Tax=Pelagomonas calceolata TaxID=35677 RepID=A0A8J2SR21_9STRA|nr:unnamed protein product [Pelagomonas calceolata]